MGVATTEPAVVTFDGVFPLSDYKGRMTDVRAESHIDDDGILFFTVHEMDQLLRTMYRETDSDARYTNAAGFLSKVSALTKARRVQNSFRFMESDKFRTSESSGGPNWFILPEEHPYAAVGLHFGYFEPPENQYCLVGSRLKKLGFSGAYLRTMEELDRLPQELIAVEARTFQVG